MSALRERVLRMRDALLPRTPDPTVALVPAGDLMEADRFRFVGAWFEIQHVGHFGNLVEVHAVDPYGALKVEFQPHEAIEVRLPRPKPGAQR